MPIWMTAILEFIGPLIYCNKCKVNANEPKKKKQNKNKNTGNRMPLNKYKHYIVDFVAGQEVAYEDGVRQTT